MQQLLNPIWLCITQCAGVVFMVLVSNGRKVSLAMKHVHRIVQHQTHWRCLEYLPRRKYPKNLSHINNMVMIHGHESAMVVFQTQGVTIIAAFWTMKRIKRCCSLSAELVNKAGMGRTQLMSIHSEYTLQQALWSQNISALQPFKGGYFCILYDTYDKTGSYNSLCSHCCQRSGWTSVKTTTNWLEFTGHEHP